MRLLILLAAFTLAACSPEPAPVVAAGARTETFSVEAGLIEDLLAANEARNATDKAGFEAMMRFYGVAAKLRDHGLKYDTEGHSHRGEQRITRVYRVASEDVVEFYKE